MAPSELSEEQQQLLALLLAEEELEPPSAPSLRIDEGAWFEPFPLTDVQQAYLLGRSERFELGGVACHGYQEFDAPGLDVARYEDAWNRTIARHAMLRAVVTPGGAQVVAREVPRFVIPVTDLREVDEVERARALAAVRQEMSHRVPDLHRWPIVRVRASLLPGGVVRVHVSSDALLLDSHSTRLVYDEVSRFYREPSLALEPLPLTFRDYALYRKAREDSDEWRASEAYWLRKAETMAAAPELPVRSNLSELKNQRFHRRQVRLDATAWRRLQERGREAGATTSVVVLAAFVEVLRAYGRRRDVTLNLTIFDPEPIHPAIGRLVGDFTRTLLLEARDPGGTFRERVQALQESFLGDLEHRHVSGTRVLRHYATHHGRSGAAVMPVVFTSAVAGEAGHGALLPHPGELTHAVTQTPQVLLDHQLYEDQGFLVVAWDSVDEAFFPGVLDAMFASYSDLLRRLSAPGAEAWSEVTSVGLPAEQAQARQQANATAHPLPDDLLHDGFFRSALAHPDRLALVDGSSRLTYRSLARRVAALGETLAAVDLAPEQLVAVVMERGWEQAVATLAVLESGAAYVPLDPAWPDQRLAAVLASSGTRLVLTQPALRERLAALTSLPVEAVLDEERTPGPRRPARARPGDLAYVIYTSGSTGTPKGVAIEHRAAVNTLDDLRDRFALGDSDRVFALSSLSFDLSVFDLFGAFGAGAAVVLCERAHGKDPSRWAEQMAEHGVTVWNSVPALLQMLVDYTEGREGRETPGWGASLRLALLSGDWVPPELVPRLRRLAPHARGVSLGGATEAAIWSIWHAVEGPPPAGFLGVPYGKPLRNQRWYVLGERGQECPDGVIGELHIGGEGLARGYWRDDVKTRERFVTWGPANERLYRTGDLGRYHPGGVLEILGREDAQVKVGGHRIELGEIEAALRQHPQVKQAAVVAQGEARSARKQLVGFVVTDAEVSEEELREHVRQRLPESMVPRWVRRLSSLPLSGNGKVDRGALPLVEGADEARDFVAPRSELERTLARVVASALSLEDVSVTERFFDLGATSQMLVTIHAALEAKLGRPVVLLDLFEFPTVAGMAGRLHDAVATDEMGDELVRQAREQGQRRRQLRRPAPGNNREDS